MSGCSVNGCDREHYSAGLCSRHYNRRLATGTTDDGPRARAPLDVRFWRQVEKRGPDDCWPWNGKSRVHGYGYVGRGGRGGGKVTSHRAAWELTFGPIPEADGYHGAVVMHTCDNRLCCNPAHLRLGTQGENVADMDAKARRRTVAKAGAEHHHARFTEEDIRFIRSSPLNGAELGRMYGVQRQVIGNIRRRVSWRHVP